MIYSRDMESAINAIRWFHKTAAELAAKEKAAKERYQPEVAKSVIASIPLEYREARTKALEAVGASLQSFRNKYNTAKSAALTRSAENPDFKLLSLPVKLSADDLRRLINRNANDKLFLQAVREYAEKNGYNDRTTYRDILCAGLPNGEDHLLSHEQALAELEGIFANYIGDCPIPSQKDEANSYVFEKLESQGIFEKFDNTFRNAI